MSKRILILAVSLLAACSQGPVRPVEIEEADACALCKMAISQKQYAAELIDSEQRVFKFDDIGCMIQFAREHGLIAGNPGRIHMFVRDYSSREWLKTESAQFVRSTNIQSPMGSGLAAFSTREKAEDYAAKIGGELLNFAEISADGSQGASAR